MSRVKGESRLDGQVILLHSIYPSTVEATKTLVPWLQEQGYQLVTISEPLDRVFNDQVEPNRSYNYDYFRFQVPELPTAAEPAAPDGPLTSYLISSDEISSDEKTPPGHRSGRCPSACLYAFAR